MRRPEHTCHDAYDFDAAVAARFDPGGVACSSRTPIFSGARSTPTTPGGTSSSAQADDLVAWAGQPKPTTLPELLQLAVRQAPALQSARLDIAVAEAQVARDLGAPRLDGRRPGHLRQVGQHGVQRHRAPGHHAGDRQRRPVARAADGRHDRPALDTNYNQTDASAFINASTYWTSDVSGSIPQPLLKGYGSTLYDAQERRATLSRDAAVLARRLAALNTVQAVISAYWDLVLAERQVAITEQSLALARERLRVTEIQVKGGKVADAEVPAVQQIIATREEDVLNGELLVLDRSIALRRAVGMPIGAGDLGLRVTTELEARDQKLDLAALVERAYDASPELAQLAKQDKSSTIDIEVTENGLLPQLDLALSIGPRGTDTTFHDAVKDMAEFKAYQVNGSLTFSRSLHQYDVRCRSRELRATREKLRGHRVRRPRPARRRRWPSRSHRSSSPSGASCSASARSSSRTRTSASRPTGSTSASSTNFDVLNRLEEQRQAELRKAQALIDWHKAETVVQTLTGDLLPAFGITVD